MDEQRRWIVEIEYLTTEGITTFIHQIEELDEIGALISQGPDWSTIQHIYVDPNPHRSSKTKTT